jgi:two-component system sensor histidine kinase and response regulator WspE
VRLESEAATAQHIEPLMRAAHSIKGAARIVGVDLAVRLAHAMEEVFVAAQRGETRLQPADIDVLLHATDVLAELAKLSGDDVSSWTSKHEATVGELTQQLHAQLTRKESAARNDEKSPAARNAVQPPVPKIEVNALSTAAEIEAETALELRAPDSTETAEAVVRVTAQNLTRLMGLAGESLVQARWLQPFTTALLKLKKHQDHLGAVLENLAARAAAVRERSSPPLPYGRGSDLTELINEAQRQSALCRQALAQRIAEFEDHAAHAEDLNARLYLEVIGSRLRPFADGVGGFPRMVRDLARSLGKQVRLEISGQTTEVDRDILDKLEAPLTHLLRNALDHGIETPEERRTAGKAECGLLRLEARHRAGMLLITVAEDGRGIDLDRLRNKIIERGLSRADLVSTMSEAELLSFLFLPGFSTAAAVTEFSGRGVGLDVVHEMARKVGGSVQVSTRPGRGTTFHLRLPITLSVMRAVIVDIGGEPYAFAHNRIDRLLRVPRAALASLENRQFIDVDGRNVGLVLATQLFDAPSQVPEGDELPVLLVSDDAGQYGLIVDSFRGEQDLVVRPLDPRLGKVPNVSALAILDDGVPVLVADVEDLIRSMDRFIQTGTLARYEPESTGETRRKRVLVVEDSITVREVERQILRQHGYDVTVAVDGQEGWNLLIGAATVREREGGGLGVLTQPRSLLPHGRGSDLPFDLIITDVDMPRMNGLELIRAIRANAALHDVPVIIISYKDREEDRLRGLEVGANHYLTKSSFHDNTFVQAVVDLIGEP